MGKKIVKFNPEPRFDYGYNGYKFLRVTFNKGVDKEEGFKKIMPLIEERNRKKNRVFKRLFDLEEEQYKSAINLLEALENDDDVQNVYANLKEKQLNI